MNQLESKMETNPIIIDKIKKDTPDTKWLTSSKVTEYLVEKRSFTYMLYKEEIRSIHITLQYENHKVARIYIEDKIGANSILIRRLDDLPTKVRLVDPDDSNKVIGYLLDVNSSIEGPIKGNFKDITNIHKYFQISPPDASINKIKRHNNVLCFDG